MDDDAAAAATAAVVQSKLCWINLSDGQVNGWLALNKDQRRSIITARELSRIMRLRDHFSGSFLSAADP